MADSRDPDAKTEEQGAEDKAKPRTEETTGHPDAKRDDTVRVNISELPYMETPYAVALPPYVPRLLSMGGLIFLAAAFFSITGLVMMVTMQTIREQGGAVVDLEGVTNMADLLGRYLAAFAAPTLLLLVAIIASATGYMLLRAAGAATKEVIPQEDRPLLERMLLQSPEQGIEQYIRLSSLSGVSGFFTKIGLSGLPLATITLTLIFTVLSIWDESFSELAKLTLGVFLGSYVQRHAEMQQQTKE